MSNYPHQIIFREDRPFLAISIDANMKIRIGDRLPVAATILAMLPQKG
jgi:hypothetical protein